MKPKSFSIVIISLIFILIYGCQKENDFFENTTNHTITNQKDAKLKQVLLYASIENDVPISILEEYEYDDEGRISKVSSPMYEDGEIVGTIKYDLYNYNSEGQLIKIEHFNANINSPTGFINLRNHIYTYSDDGKKEKEYIEYPVIGSSEYLLYKYDKGNLAKIEKYGIDGNLEKYIINEYDNSGNLIKETSFHEDNNPFSYTQHAYKNGLNMQSNVYAGDDMQEHLREIIRTYDENNNLVILESNELSLFSSVMSYVLKYEYFD